VTRDLLERVRDANPVPVDPPGQPIEPLLERLDPERHPTGPGLRRVRSLIAAGVVLAVVVSLGLALRPNGHSVDVAAAFVRATAPPARGVLHVKWELYEPARQGHPAMTARHEFWVDAANERTHSIDSFGSGPRALHFERATAGRQVRTWSRSDPHKVFVGRQSTQAAGISIRALLDTIADVRDSYGAHHLRLLGRELHAGRSVWHLVTTFNQPHVRVDVLADAQTYAPVEVQFRRLDSAGRVGRTTQVNTYTVYERLPDNARTRATLSMSPHPGAHTTRCEPHHHCI
jgi:hypothetical protein